MLWKTPGLSKSLSTSWEGPFTVAARIGEVNYKISWKQGSKTHHKVVYINQLKPFKKSDSLPCHKVLTILDQKANQEDDPFIPDHFKGPDLSDTMKSELDSALSQFPSVYSNKPGNTTLAKHCIKTSTNSPIWSPAYTIPVNIEAKFKEELDNLIADGIIEESDSPWCSPPQ